MAEIRILLTKWQAEQILDELPGGHDLWDELAKVFVAAYRGEPLVLAEPEIRAVVKAVDLFVDMYGPALKELSEPGPEGQLQHG